jgi:superfamily II RNA helicase
VTQRVLLRAGAQVESTRFTGTGPVAGLWIPGGMTSAPLRLAAGERLAPGDILDRFVAWATSRGLSLYPAQEEAILALLDGKHLVLATPTGSGKSMVATFLHWKSVAEGKRSFYTCPIKALVNEKFFALCELFGAENVAMMTGDASINREAPIVCCTAEILANLVVRDEKASIDAVVMDEFHYYADKERGAAWQVPLLSLEQTVFVLMSATLGDTRLIEDSLVQLTGREVASVKSSERPVPLEYHYKDTPLFETIAGLVRENKQPIYLVSFTQRAAVEEAQNLMSVDLCTREEKEAIRDALVGARFESPFGKDFQRYVRHGVGLHHAGLLPKYRLLCEKLAQKGLLKVISGTDTLGMGINIPLRTVLFTQLCKYDGEKTAILSARDFHQIAGRAGRKGFDERGYVVTQAPAHVIENKRLERKAERGKKVVKQKPPEKGYVAWDEAVFKRLIDKEPEPLEGRFDVSFDLLVGLLGAPTSLVGGGYRRLTILIARSHGQDRQKKRLRRLAAERFRTLRQAGVLELHGALGYAGRHVRLAKGLQREFSLHHTLSLYLLDSLTLLDPQRDTHALDIVTQVEAILEDPDVILYKQLDRAKGIRIAELKAQGVEYDERMAELEKVEYPKPNRDFIYETFNAFADKHPWVGQENIRPKSIAREMFERYTTFADYVRDYDLERSEGVLLRYLTQVYKTLAQNVPEGYRQEGLEDVIAYLEGVVRGVDASLLEEWQGLAHPGTPARVTPAAPSPKRELTADPRAFAARLRHELHRLLFALAKRDYVAASAAVFQPEADWPAARLEQEMAAYYAVHASVDTTPAARRPDSTFITLLEPRLWQVRQRLVDPNGDLDYMIDCRVDLRRARDEDAPLIELVRIGT